MANENQVTFPIDEPVDFVIVGSGSAGGIIAKELSTNGFKVVVLEQGPFRRVEAAAEWFLDSFQAGDETLRTVREDLDRKDKSP